MFRVYFLALVGASVAAVANAQADSCPLVCSNAATCLQGEADFSAHPRDIHDVEFPFHKDVDLEGWFCQCAGNFTGLRCNRPFVQCDGNGLFCYHGGKCIDGLADEVEESKLFCDCSEAEHRGKHYVGKHCEIELSQKCDGDSGSFCVNGGSCRPGFEDKPHPCECLEGHRGTHCEFDVGYVPECVLDCAIGGQCTLGIKNYETALYSEFWALHDGNFQYCNCPAGFFGVRCEIEGEECGDGHCFNGGSCLELEIEGQTTYQCDCRDAGDEEHSYGGQYCQSESDSFCTKNANQNGHLFCTNGGTCNEESHLDCECPPGFHGPICEFTDNQEDVPKCTLQCKNGGRCRVGAKDNQLIAKFGHNLNNYNQSHNGDWEHCVCPDGFFGIECEHELQICPGGDHVCLHGSKCVPLDEVNGGTAHECDCEHAATSEEKFAGTYCQYSSTDICTNDGRPGAGKAHFAFCVNNGQCKSKVGENENHPGCTCPDGFTGDHCEFLEDTQQNAADDEDETVASAAEESAPDNSGLVVALAVALLVLVLIIATYMFKRLMGWRTFVAKQDTMGPETEPQPRMEPAETESESGTTQTTNEEGAAEGSKETKMKTVEII